MPPASAGLSIGRAGRAGQIVWGGLGSCIAMAPLLAIKFAPIPIVFGFIPVAVVFAMRIPFLLCLGFVSFSFFRLHEAFPVLNPFKIPLLLALPTLASLVWHTFATRQIKPYWNRELSAFAVFFVLVTIGVIFASNKPTAISYWTGNYVKIGIMTLAIAWLTREPKQFFTANYAIVFSGVAVAYVAIFNKLNGLELVEGTRVSIGRSMGSVLGDPNDLSLVLSFPLGFAISLVITKHRMWLRALGLVAACVIIYAIICTQSRGGLLAILAVSGIAGMQVIRSKLVLGGIGAVAGMVLLAAAGVNDRQSGGAHEEGIDESAMGRIYAWGAAWNMALKNPLTGVGLDNFTDNYFFYSTHWDGMNHAVHSTWFGVLGETGFLGFISFMTMMGFTIYRAVMTKRLLEHADVPPIAKSTSLAMVACLAGFCASGTFLTQGFTWPIYVLIAMTVGVAEYARGAVSETGESSRNSQQAGARSCK